MSWCLGIDTSNYTTSVAAYNNKTKEMISLKKKLPVQKGGVGLRQSDAVFAHVKQLGKIIQEISGQVESLVAVGVSTRPRDKSDSYMPCFLTGKLVAESIALTSKIPYYLFSHQIGHIGAVIFDTNRTELLSKPFIAFHLSGGTTECIYATPNEEAFFKVEEVFQSLDLYAGQAVDRIGGMLGLDFPAGVALEKLALTSNKFYKTKPFINDGNPSISGLENQCRKMFADGESKEDIAKFAFDWLGEMLAEMTRLATEKYPNTSVLYAGGVMANSIIKKRILQRFEAYFASPKYSEDNAAGIAFLTAKTLEGNQNVNT